MDVVIILFLVIWVAGEVVPWIVLRSRGIRLSFFEYSSRLIKKNIFAIYHNNRVFDALQIIQNNKIDISVRELEELYNANIDFNEIVDALLLAKNKNVIVSKEALRELAYFKKDLVSVINTKNGGEEVILAEVVENYVEQRRVPAPTLVPEQR